MQRDILFFLKGIPKRHFVVDRHYFLASIVETGEQLVSIIRQKFPAFDLFDKTWPQHPLIVFGFRNDTENVESILKMAYRQISGLMDGYSLILDEPPIMSDLALVRVGNDDHSEVYVYSQEVWGTLNSPESNAGPQWEGRNALLLQMLLHFFDVVANDPKAPPSDLRTNLMYALKMYSHGASSKSHGIEFLTKFSALECLVCGSATHGKEDLLKKRLLALFSGEDIVDNEMIERLWELRCSASHQARAFPDIEELGLYPLAVGTINVEQIFSGAAYFALENAHRVSSIEELWELADQYILPELIVGHRPKGMARMPINFLASKMNCRIENSGKLFDVVYSAKR